MPVFYNENQALMMEDLVLDDLAKQYGTLLIVYNEQLMKRRINDFHLGFQ